MPQLIAALFAQRPQAEQALQALMGAGVARDRIGLVGGEAAREVSSISGFRDLSRDDDFAALHDLPIPDEELRVFEEALGQGCTLVHARVEKDDLEEAIAVIETFDPLDLDHRNAAWRTSHSQGPAGADLGAPLGAGITGGAAAGQTNTGALPGMGAVTDRTDETGTADLRTSGVSLEDQGLSTMATGQRRAEERAGAPGVMELQGTSGGRMRLDPNRLGRVRSYTQDD